MSATNRGTEREPADGYLTPAWCTWRLLDEIGAELPGGQWCEPMAGEGDIIRAVDVHRARTRRPPVRWTAVELRRPCVPLLERTTRAKVIGGDFFRLVEKRELDLARFSVVIGNPAYGALATLTVRLLLERAPQAWKILLLGQSFQASAARSSLLRTNCPDALHLPDRPPFRRRGTSKGTDARDYNWLVWPPYARRPEGRNKVLDVTPQGLRAALDAERAAWARMVGAPSARR